MEVQPDLSVLVAAPGQAALIRRFLGALYGKADHVGLETFVAVSDPTGDDALLAEEFPALTLVEYNGAGPPGRFVNEILERSRGRYFSLWDQSAVIADGCLAALVDFLDEVPDAGIVGPKIRDESGRIQPVARRFPSVFSLFFSSSPLPGRPDSGWGEYVSGEADWFAGPGMVVNRCLLDEINGIHPRLSGSFWQIELCRQAKRCGWHTHYLHDAQATGSLERWQAAMGGIGAGMVRRLWEVCLLMWPRRHG
ncbi:MAG: glycosyltransferase [Pseudomonadota bacterium]